MGKPNGKPVRIYTLNERATKFRNSAACLSWSEKTGSAEKKAYILGLLPAGATHTYSLGGDLSKAQQEQMSAANKGKFPNRRRKDKRIAEAYAQGADPTLFNSPQARDKNGEKFSNEHFDESTSPSLPIGPCDQDLYNNSPETLDHLESFDLSSQFDLVPSQHGHGAGPSPLAGRNINYTQDLEGDEEGQRRLGDAPRIFDGQNSSAPALYDAVYSGQTIQTGFSAIGGTLNSTRIAAQETIVNHPVYAQSKRNRRCRLSSAHKGGLDQAYHGSKYARTDAPVVALKNNFSLEPLGPETDGLLLMDDQGYVIPRKVLGFDSHDDEIDQEFFERFLYYSHQENAHCDPSEAQLASATNSFNDPVDRYSGTPACSLIQGQKRRVSLDFHDVEEANNAPACKRLRRELAVQVADRSINDLFKESSELLDQGEAHTIKSNTTGEGQHSVPDDNEDNAINRLSAKSTPQRQEPQRPISAQSQGELSGSSLPRGARNRTDMERTDSALSAPARRGQKRSHDEDQADNTDAGLEEPTSKRQRVEASSDGLRASGDDDDDDDDECHKSTSDFAESGEDEENYQSTSDFVDSDEDEEDRQSTSDSGDFDGHDNSDKTFSPYSQTSLKSITRPQMGGKGPANTAYRPTTGGKGPHKTTGGKGPWKGADRPNNGAKRPVTTTTRPIMDGKGPLKTTSRANIARKTPSKNRRGS